MSTYKVIQDIEAEDKLLGPLSLRQFGYAVGAIVLGFIAFKLATLQPLLAIPFLPPVALLGLLAAPLGSEQSSEVWLLAKIRFALKPRKRIWNQSGLSELVTITAPKKVERILTDGLSQTEVRSRLRALANTIDSRGWAVKNVNINMYGQPAYAAAGPTTDRLLDGSSMPQEVQNYEVLAGDDILDERNNPTAAHLDQMITASAQAHRQAVIQQMQQPAAAAPAPVGYTTPQYATQPQQPADYWFMNNPNPAPNAPAGYTTPGTNTPVFPGQTTASPSSAMPVAAAPTAEEQALLEKQHREMERANPMHSHLKTIQPLSAKKPKHTEKKPAEKAPDPKLQQLANNNDLNITTIARQAKQVEDNGEVVISLH